MDQKYAVLVLASLLAAHSQEADAAPVNVTRTTTTAVSVGGAFTVDVPLSSPVGSADELVSISSGSFGDGGEGGTFTIAVKYDTNATQVIYSFPADLGGDTNFDTLSDLSFLNGTVTDLVFSFNSFADSLSIPSGTVFTFQTEVASTPTSVPEPASLALVGTGLAAGLLASRRKRPKT